MATFYTYDDPIMITYRDGSVSDPYVSITETNLIIVNNKVILRELPSKFYHVTIAGYSEIFSGSPSATQFKTNYSLGICEFDPSQDATVLPTISYYGRGQISYPAEKIYESVGGGNVQDYLENLTSTDTSLQGQIDSISLAASNAQIGVFSLDATGTNTLSATYADLTYFNGLKINLTIENTNTGAVTLNLNALGAVDLKYVDSDGAKQDIPPGGLLVGNVYLLEHDGTDFIVLNDLHAPDYTSIPATYSDILAMSDYTFIKSKILWQLKGMTYTNIAEDSWATSLTGWTSSYQSIVSNKYRLAKSSDTAGYRNITLDTSKNYLITIYMENASDSNGAYFALWNGASGQIQASGTLTTTQSIRRGIIVSSAELAGVSPRIYIYHKGNGTLDNSQFFIQEITAAEYAEGLTEMMTKYSYIAEGTQSTSEVAIEAVGKNLFDKSNNIKSDANITHVVEESRNCVKFDASKPFIDDVFPLGNDFQASTQYTIQYTAKQTNAGSNPRLRFVYTDGTTTDIGSSLGTVFVAITATSTAGKTISHIKFVYTGIGAYYLYVDKDTIQIEEGSTATTYVPYTITQSFIPTVGKRLPNDTGDTIEIYQLDGDSNPVAIQARKVKRVSDTASISDTIYDSLDTGTYTNVDVVKTTAFSLAAAGTAAINSMTRYYNNAGLELTEIAASSIDYATSVGKYYYHTDKTLWIVVTGGAYANISTARTVLATSSLDYQLATEITTQVIGISDLLAHTDGTIYATPNKHRRAIAYDSGLALPYEVRNSSTDWIETVILTDGEIDTTIDKDDITVVTGATSITLTSGTDNEIYYVVWQSEPEDTTQPELTAYVAANQAAKVHMMEEAMAISSAEKSVDIAYQNAINDLFESRITALEP